MKDSHSFEGAPNAVRNRWLEAQRGPVPTPSAEAMRTRPKAASGCACTASRRDDPRVGRRSAPYCLALSLGLAALVPKCPMCLAAYLSLVGIGGGLAGYAHPFLRPLSIVLVALALGGVLLQSQRARRLRRPPEDIEKPGAVRRASEDRRGRDRRGDEHGE